MENNMYIKVIYLILFITFNFAFTYTIGPNDTLAVDVIEDPSFKTNVRVDPDGNIDLPLINKVNVKNLTPSEAGQRIKKILIKKNFFIDPNVSISVTEFGSQKVLVLGEVKVPGSYTLKSDTTVLDVITKAGGINPRGSRNVLLIRKKTEKEKLKDPDDKSITISLTIDFDALMKGEKLEENYKLRNGDVIHVKRSFF